MIATLFVLFCFFNIYVLYILLICKKHCNPGILDINSGTKKKPQNIKILQLLSIWEVKGVSRKPWAQVPEVKPWMAVSLTTNVCQEPKLGGHGDNVGTLEHVHWQTSELPQTFNYHRKHHTCPVSG